MGEGEGVIGKKQRGWVDEEEIQRFVTVISKCLGSLSPGESMHTVGKSQKSLSL